MSGWTDVPLRHDSSCGRSAPGDTTAQLLGQHPYRTSSGRTDDSSPRLPSPHNRTAVTEPQQRSHSEGFMMQGQPSWHRCTGGADTAAPVCFGFWEVSLARLWDLGGSHRDNMHIRGTERELSVCVFEQRGAGARTISFRLPQPPKGPLMVLPVQ